MSSLSLYLSLLQYSKAFADISPDRSRLYQPQRTVMKDGDGRSTRKQPRDTFLQEKEPRDTFLRPVQATKADESLSRT